MLSVGLEAGEAAAAVAEVVLGQKVAHLRLLGEVHWRDCVFLLIFLFLVAFGVIVLRRLLLLLVLLQLVLLPLQLL